MTGGRPIVSARRPALWARALRRLPSAKFDATRRIYQTVFGGDDETLITENVEFVWRYYTHLLLLFLSPFRRRLQRSVQAHGATRLSHALVGENGGAIIVSCHLGEMEIAGSWLAGYCGREVVVVVDAVKPKFRQAFFDGVRRACDIGLRRQTETSLEDLCNDLDAGRIVLLMLDRRSGTPSVASSFMGRQTRLSLAPWLLAVRADVPILAAWTHRSPDGKTTLQFSAPATADDCRALGPEAIVQCLASDLELAVRAAPAQWHIPADLSQLPLTDSVPERVKQPTLATVR